MLKVIPFYSALNKPNLFMGGEREWMMLSFVIAFIVIYAKPSVVNAILSAVIWLVLSTSLRMMAKKDPIMTKIYKRHLRYAKYYRAKPSAFA